jgi:hypothetical protein
MAAPRLRLVSGLPVLERWAEDACQADKNVIYRALFAVADGSIFLSHEVTAIVGRPPGFIFMVRDDLELEISLLAKDEFEIRHIGITPAIA